MAGMLESWAASSNFGRNAKALSTELRLVKATLEEAANKEMSWLQKLDIEERLGKLRDSMHNADDLLDKLDYFRIQDKEHNTYEAADKHGKGCFCNLALNARHTAKVSCCRWLRAKRRQRPRGDSSSSPHTNQEVSGCMPKLGKLLPCSSSSPPHPHVPGQHHVNAQEKPTLEFNRVNFSQNMKDVEQKLQLMRTEVNEILQSHGPGIVPAQSHLITKNRIDEQLYGRDHVMNSIIHDITKGQYSDKGITVLPVVGPGGVGKTTLIQHIYSNKQVQNHFPVRIWMSVSLSFNLDKVLEHIKACTLAVERENECSTTDELIEQRLKYKRFLLVLDDIWQISNMDDWEKLLLILGQSQEKGCMILVTTRLPLIAERVNTADHPKVLDGLEPQEFRKLFLAFVFDDEQCPRDKKFLLETGDKIMGKLKGSPLAVKTVARLLRKDLSLGHWERVLNSRQWEEHTGDNEIMLALKISYDFLPFHLQQCFAYSGLFPKDFHSSSSQLINLWIGLDILKPVGRNKTFEDIGLSHLNDLVTQGFFREEETNGCPCYVMHDLLHDLASSISSHENLTLHCSNVGSVDIPPSIRHLSIIIDDDNAVSSENFKIELRKLEMRFNVQNLQTLMLFGEMDESLANIFGYLFRDANALRVLHLHEMSYPVESILHNLSTLVHLRYLFLRTKVRGLMHRFSVSFKHLKFLQVLDLDGCDDLGNSAMVDICLMIKLKYLSLKKTQVTTLPPRIGELQNLETLDVRQTQVKEIPEEILQLPKLTHLHFGQSGCFGVKLPVGIDQLESVQVMGTVDSRECSESAMKEISELPELRELEVVMYDGSDDMEQNDNLLSFIGKCSNLKSLTIYGDSNLRDKPLPESPPESPDFPKLEKLKVAGRFVKVPCWIAQLRTLTLLVIRVCKLEVNDLVIIGRLPYLSVLELALVALPRKEVTITSSAGFARLEVFCFDCRVPWVNFQEKAMPNLEQLQLKLYSGPADKVPSGIMLLERLNNVTLLYSSQYAGSVGVRETVNVATRDATSHANLIELSINGDREIFLPNISADRVVPGTEFDTSVNTGAEIEEVPASK